DAQRLAVGSRYFRNTLEHQRKDARDDGDQQRDVEQPPGARVGPKNDDEQSLAQWILVVRLHAPASSCTCSAPSTSCRQIAPRKVQIYRFRLRQPGDGAPREHDNGLSALRLR